MTIDELLERLGLGDWFREYYLLPICGAIWSTSPARIGAFPARTMVGFFRNHGLLSATKQHQWWTVRGGSVEYVRRLEARLRRMGCELRTSAPVSAVWRDGRGAFVATPGAPPQHFDQVIMACHSDQAHRLVSDGTAEERRILSAIRYQDNRAVLHSDTAQMPRRRACWSSWVYQADTTQAARSLGVTYWMNRLQAIPDEDPLFVTLNPSTEIADHLTHDDVTFRHPVFDAAAIAAQRDLAAIQGRNRTWFAGAWTRFGFHEDGFASAVSVAGQIGCQSERIIA
jgi:predicted NAD/FAD-binding protein